MKLFSHRDRAVHLGPYPLERLPRLEDTTVSTSSGRRREESRVAGPQNAGHAYQLYADMFDDQRTGDVAEESPAPDDPLARAEHLKAGLYFLDADMAGCGTIPDSAWSVETHPGHAHAVVVLIAHTRIVGENQPGDEWIDGTRQINADLRAAELAVLTAGYIRRLGFDAMAHTPTASDVDVEQLALQSGLIESIHGELRAPYLSGGFALAAVTTDMALAADPPLARRGLLDKLRSTRSLGWMLGRGGTRAGIGRLNGDHRPLHMGRYPMERIKRVPEATTLIIPDEVKRVPVRAGGFPRAAHGDMGPKFQKDVKVFSYKTPQAQAYIQQIGEMVPYQDGEVAPEVAPGNDDPDRNADALKALAYHLGGDMVGVCEVPEYAWYSHNGAGEEITPRHKYGVVILLDQGYETMEGASGDDWVSGAQSMRAYMRGAQIAGIMAEHLRSLGYGARSHTNRDSEVLHIP
ncbi:MAG: Fe-S protein, partial [Acidimicrobiales bacterium]|nr:Fe-S protein [Acidimicrobiales bacterium]